MDAGYFYDTNYHLTTIGTIDHTARLIQDLQNFMGEGEPVDITIPPPPTPEGGYLPMGQSSAEPGDMPLPQGRNRANAGMMPPPGAELPLPNEPIEDAEAAETPVVEAEPEPTPVPTPEVVGSSRDAAYFTYTEYNEGLAISGVTEEGKKLSELEVPWLIDGKKVFAIAENAFEGCDALRVIYIQSNISRIMQSAFDGAPRLTEIHIDNDAGANILVPGVGLFDNVPGRLRVYVPQSSFGSFLADYFWGNYNDRLESE